MDVRQYGGSRPAARAADVLADLERDLPNSIAVPTDVRSDDDVRALTQAALQRFGRIDGLIHAAGRGMWSEVERIDIVEYRELFELNVVGCLQMIQAVIPPMRKQGASAIVVVSSKLTRSFTPTWRNTPPSNPGRFTLAFSARAELADARIVVSVIRPKLVATDFGSNAVRPEPASLRDPTNASAPPIDTPAFVAGKIVELLRSGEAELDL